VPHFFVLLGWENIRRDEDGEGDMTGGREEVKGVMGS
jgi:hypothetical protein